MPTPTHQVRLVEGLGPLVCMGAALLVKYTDKFVVQTSVVRTMEQTFIPS